MGCDIHFVVEQKFENQWVGIFDNGYRIPFGGLPWEARDKIPLYKLGNRNYAFFAALAGVRGDGPEALDVPPDASLMSKMAIKYWDSDGHSHSYCSLREFVAKRLMATEQTDAGELMRDRIKGDDTMLRQYLQMDEDDPALDEFRVVFWFDN